MSILLVTAYTERDAHLAERLYNRIGLLGGCHKNKVLFVTDQSTKPETIRRVNEAARKHVQSLETITLAPCRFGNKWPVGPNWAFMWASQKVKDNYKTPFLWLESDCVPIKEGWMDAIEAEYAECTKRGKIYMGSMAKFKGPANRTGMWGIAVYSPRVHDVFVQHASRRMNIAFDVTLAPHIMPLAHYTKLFQFSHGPRGTIYRIETLKHIRPDAVLFHQDKFGDLERLLDNKSREETKISERCNFAAHSGDRGDVIYSMPVCLAKGYRKLVLYPDRCTRELMTRESAESLATLLRVQPYIDECVFSDEIPKDAFNLSGFRSLLGKLSGEYLGHNLAGLHARWAGLPEGIESDKWLWVTPRTPPKPIIFARSKRYHSTTLDWRKCMSYYKDRCVFVGSRDEHDEFCRDFGIVPYLETKTLLDLAQYIAGSDLLVCNQSCPYSIAEGLKHPSIIEWVDGPSQNCHFSRKDLWYGTECYELPALVKKPEFDWHVLTDLHSGLGRVAYEYYINTKRLKLNWIPTRKSDGIVQFDRNVILSEHRSGAPTFLLEAVPFIREYSNVGDVIYSMWESTKLPNSVVRAINNGPFGIVPSAWCKQIYQQSGVTKPLFCVPLGVDTMKFVPSKEFEPKDTLVFGAAGRFCGDGNPRKNIDKVISGFIAAFPTENDVRLEIKGYDACLFKCDDPRIRIYCDFWPESMLVDWYQKLDVFINLASGGGWELHAQEAMACGAVPVVLDWSSSLEFVDEICGYLVKPKLVDANWGVYSGLGQWALPDMDHYIETLRSIRQNRAYLKRRRILSRRSVEDLTWVSATNKLEKVLEKLYA